MGRYYDPRQQLDYELNGMTELCNAIWRLRETPLDELPERIEKCSEWASDKRDRMRELLIELDAEADDYAERVAAGAYITADEAKRRQAEISPGEDE